MLQQPRILDAERDVLAEQPQQITLHGIDRLRLARWTTLSQAGPLR